MRILVFLIAAFLFAVPAVADQTTSPDMASSIQTAGPAPDYLSKLFPQSETEQPAFSQVQAAACCKICRKGKACGNSCISRDKTCRKGPGCACDAD